MNIRDRASAMTTEAILHFATPMPSGAPNTVLGIGPADCSAVHDEALAALLKTYLQLEHKLVEIRSEARTLHHQMEYVRATLLVCRPDLQLAEILPTTPPAETAARRKQSVMALEVLKEAAIPLTSREVVIRLLLRQGYNKPDEPLI